MTPGMHIRTCFICRQQVLGLIGQDLFLDTFYLHDDKEDHEAVAEEAFGECHLQCLIHSKWGSFWAKRIVENLRDVRKYRSLFSNDKLHMLQNSAMGETVIVQRDGWVVSVTDRTLLASIATSEGRFLPVHQEINIPFPQNLRLIEDLEQALTVKRSFPLPEFIDRLGITDRLLYPEAIRGGEIRPLDSGDTPIKPITRVRGDTYLTATLFYYQYLPEDVAQTLVYHLSRPAS